MVVYHTDQRWWYILSYLAKPLLILPSPSLTPKSTNLFVRVKQASTMSMLAFRTCACYWCDKVHTHLSAHFSICKSSLFYCYCSVALLTQARKWRSTQHAAFCHFMKMFILSIVSLWLVSVSIESSLAKEITGTARIIDGDTIVIDQQVIRLLSIDAPENGQHCTNADGQKYNCGAASENYMKSLIQQSVSCSAQSMDNYKRLLAYCQSGGIDINREMVRSGHAIVFRRFSDEYDSEEREAKAAGRGMWGGQFIMPWDFRVQRWTGAGSDAPDPECPIKGNVNRDGIRIYHAPWSRSYERTTINTARGERWFCTEAEALDAGWRAPRR